jgi:formylglycine-generating enzyme required for sulfatase activity
LKITRLKIQIQNLSINLKIAEKIRKPRKKQSFNKVPKKKIDIERRILDNHKKNQLRMGTMVAISAGIVLLIVFAFRGYEQYQRSVKKTDQVKLLLASVSEIKKEIKGAEETTSYELYSKLPTVLYKLHRAKLIKPELTVQINKDVKLLKECLKSSKPIDNENYINPDGLIDMVAIKKGEFLMGRKSTEMGRYNELPQRKINIDYNFWIGKTEISNFQLRQLFPNHRLMPWGKYKMDLDLYPAVRIDWNTATIYCDILNKLAKSRGDLPNGYEYRLPTEAEWEYVARAGSSTTYYWGDDFGDIGAEYANVLDLYTAKKLDWKTGTKMAKSDHYCVSAPVGSLKPNAWGVYDMVGNVWEWCWDWYSPTAYGKLPKVDPVQVAPEDVPISKRESFDAGYYTIKSTAKVIRGGSWGNLPQDSRCGARDYVEPTNKDYGMGFRVVLAPKIDVLRKK